ncbi:hypothetical protein GCM10009858_34700 [Terrabacter carboxydivorans]|uniref:Uncharacterized protein n=1 Tax=Terrabacter carboxydivorans TaxID=619730 RepID=A0ABP5Z936_9MICO
MEAEVVADAGAAEALVAVAMASAAEPPIPDRPVSTRRRAGDAPGRESGRCASMRLTVRTRSPTGAGIGHFSHAESHPTSLRISEAKGFTRLM